jgi:hypothetical protein
VSNAEDVQAGRDAAQRAYRESIAMYKQLGDAMTRRRSDPDYCTACGWVGPCDACETDRARWAA